MTSPYHAKLFAFELSRRHAAGDPDAMLTALFDAAVDLNPHQVEAALFAVRSPLGKGVVLADEVGLGKTIEAGIVLCQRWAERRRRLLVIVPASLRTQWAQELSEKFHLPCKVLDARAFAGMEAEGYNALGAGRSVIILSYQFAKRIESYLQAVPWDLVVLDEAHKLRNGYKPGNVLGQSLHASLKGRQKLLLTATPFQNSLMELFGLVSLIDPDLFSDADSFATLYAGAGGDVDRLRERLRPFITRTLRSQVQEYVRYTKRIPMTQAFEPQAAEMDFYRRISDYLDRDETLGISGRQRHLTALVMRKLLASSTSAVRATLTVVRDRLRTLLSGTPTDQTSSWLATMADDEWDSELVEALLDDEPIIPQSEPETPATLSDQVSLRAQIQTEITEVEGLINAAGQIVTDAKTRALLIALTKAQSELRRKNVADKALIFTESRRTQDYLIAILEANGYADQVVAFNGSAGGERGAVIYEKWFQQHANTDRVTGSRQVDQRTALIDHFRDHARIMVATEAAAEGVNLQFCSLVINYDLPWNPQRIEQRIGRCHRYGQKHDVVVVNFLNAKNHADARVLELLTTKFQLFSGMFGASDDVLGAVESGLDFEARIGQILRTCRTPAAIDTAFAALQQELDAQINARIQKTRTTLIEHFDEDVAAKLRLRQDATAVALDQVARRLWSLLHFALVDRASFDESACTFRLDDPPVSTPIGTYGFRGVQTETAHTFRLGSPLGEWVLNTGKTAPTPTVHLTFDVSDHGKRIALVEALRGRSGWLQADHLNITGIADEDQIVLSALDDANASIDPETCAKLFNCVAHIQALPDTLSPSPRLKAEAEHRSQATMVRAADADKGHVREARERLEVWAEAQEDAIQEAVQQITKRIRGLRRESERAETLDEQLRLQQALKTAEADQRRMRIDMFERMAEVAKRRDDLIAALQRRLNSTCQRSTLFTIRWSVV